MSAEEISQSRHHIARMEIVLADLREYPLNFGERRRVRLEQKLCGFDTRKNRGERLLNLVCDGRHQLASERESRGMGEMRTRDL
jgi:hypothetical protein